LSVAFDSALDVAYVGRALLPAAFDFDKDLINAEDHRGRAALQRRVKRQK
jgi:hypothetical protein